MKFIKFSLFISLAVVFLFSNIQLSNQIKSNIKSRELYKVNLAIAQLTKLLKDKQDIQKLNEQMNMVSAFFHSTDPANNLHQNDSNHQFQQTKNNQQFSASVLNSKNLLQDEPSNQQSSVPIAGVGVRGQSCSTVQDCEQKNKDYYKFVKQRLLGENAANGEQGPQGQKGLQGLQGKQGPRGENGVSPTHDYILRITKQIAEDEIYKVAQGGVAEVDKINNNYLLDKIYYIGEQNCQQERRNYILQCQADLYPDCSNPQQPDNCCPNVQCVSAIDDLMCCFNKQKIPLDQVELFDQEIDSSWLPLLKEIDGYQLQFNSMGRRKGPSMLAEYKDRLSTCNSMSFQVDNLKCPIIRGNQNNNFNNQQQPLSQGQKFKQKSVLQNSSIQKKHIRH